MGSNRRGWCGHCPCLCLTAGEAPRGKAGSGETRASEVPACISTRPQAQSSVRRESKPSRALLVAESGRRVYGTLLKYTCRISVGLKFFQDKKFSLKKYRNGVPGWCSCLNT